MKKISKFYKYEVIKDIPSYSVKKGMIFEWDDMEDCFVTHQLPWFLSPLVTKSQMRRKIFRRVI